MDEITRRRYEREFRRNRTLGTNNPFCHVCGKNKTWIRYEFHHPGGRKYNNSTIFLCLDCHYEAHEMENDLPPIPAHVDPSRVSLIHQLRGQKVLLQLEIAQIDRTVAWLLNEVNLPPPQIGGDGLKV
jgi:hypothetical protein